MPGRRPDRCCYSGGLLRDWRLAAKSLCTSWRRFVRVQVLFVRYFSVFYKCMFLLIFVCCSKNEQALRGPMLEALRESAQNLSTQLSTDNVGNLGELSGVRRAAAGCVG